MINDFEDPKKRSNEEVETRDWRSANSLIKDLQSALNTIHKNAVRIAAREGKTDEWIVRPLSHVIGRPALLYHPDLVALLKMEKVPDVGDWISGKQLQKQLGSTPETIHVNALRIATKKGRANEWIEKRSVRGREAICYHPDLVACLKEENLWASANQLRKILKSNARTITRIAYNIAKREGKLDEWIQMRGQTRPTRPTLYYHPDLIVLLKQVNIPEADDWLSTVSLATVLGVTFDAARSSALRVAKREGKLDEWIQMRKGGVRGSKPAPHYHPELIARLKSEQGIFPEIGDWFSKTSLRKVLSSADATIQTNAHRIAARENKTREWIQDREVHGQVAECYHPDLVLLLKQEKVADIGDWVSNAALSHEMSATQATVRINALRIATRENKRSEWIEDRNVRGQAAECYHPDLATLLKQESVVGADDWVSASTLAVNKVLRSSRQTILGDAVRIANREGKTDEWIQNRKKGSRVAPHYHPELIAHLKSEQGIFPEIGDWQTATSLMGMAKSSLYKIYSDARRIADDVGKSSDWIEKRLSHGRVATCYHPDLVALLRTFYESNKNAFTNEQKKEDALIDELKKFAQNASEKTDEGTKKFCSLVTIFGSSRALDLLFKFRPEFKGLSVERVRSCLAEYLGDFLAAKHEFNLKELGTGVELLSEITFQDALYENIKGDCLRYYFEQRKLGVRGSGQDIIFSYLEKIIAETESISNEFLERVIERVVYYFNSALQDFHKPEKFVDSLAPGRDFPDINQRINMKELKDKKRVLIADEMGLGKSASVIMAKEQLGVGCALVITPAGVQETWLDYLSDDPARKGYFKPGQAPRVLLVENIEQLRDIKKTDYDYVVISQEKLKGRYAPLLMALDPDMLVVDESHKIKKVEGTRAQQLLPLAKKMGADKYVALLSGTPIPNKVRDVAIVLKMLYPDQFAEMPTPQLVHSIIHGDIVNLRSLLIPRMQMKELGDVVEMPAREEKIIDVHLSPQETELYNALVEMDELTAAEKMRALRSFLVNPAALEATPGVPCAKLSVLKARLHEALKTKSKILIIANDIVTGVMRGDNAVLTHEGLGLPPDVAIEYIHGTDGTQSDRSLRPDLQRRFNYSPEKMVLVMSGNAGGVGINLFGGQATYIYNEPWTISDLNQQKARLYRPGLDHDIVEETYLVHGSFEEGMHEYALRKHKVIEKVLKGIPISELEQQMLEKAERQKEGQEVDDVNFEENPELARVFLSWKTRLAQMFGHTKGLGEEKFVHFLKTWGAEYAEGYRKVGARSYQANCNRVAGTIIGEMAQRAHGQPAAVKILDVASGPEMLRRHIGNQFQQSVISMDINPHHFENGTFGKTYVGSWTAMPFGARMFDYVNCAMAFQDSSFAPSRGNYERLNVLREMNRVLKPGGRAVISMIYSLRMKDMEKFKLFVGACGFRLVEDYTGNVAGRTKDPNSDPVFTSQVLTLEKIVDVEKTAEQIVQDVGVDNVPGLKFEKLKSRPKNDRTIIETAIFEGGKGLLYIPNDTDRAVLNEQKEIEKMARDLREQFGTIKEIPATEIISRGFVRLLLGGRYQLFKQLKTAPGVMFIK